jgi:muramoyltetrapeptide carboxypeptidase
MMKPRALRPGDRIAVVSPASPFARQEFDAGIEEIRRLGFEPTWDDSVFARDAYVSGSPATRAAAFLEAWFDPSIAALIAVRGGYGSVHILPLLLADELRRSPKAFIGYSDNTSLLTWLTCGCGVAAFHGPMLEKRLAHGSQGYHRESFERVLTRAEPGGELAPDTLVALQDGDAEGPLYGGTLTQLLASFSTPYAFDPPEGDEPGGQPCARDVIARVLAGFPGPVLYGFPSGHTTGPCWTLPLGVRTRLVTTARPRVVIEEAAVTA